MKNHYHALHSGILNIIFFFICICLKITSNFKLTCCLPSSPSSIKQYCILCIHRGIVYIIVPIGTPGGVPAVPILQDYMPYILGLKSLQNVCTTLVIFDQFFSPTKRNKVNFLRGLQVKMFFKIRIRKRSKEFGSFTCDRFAIS